ncbi:MAG: transcription termination factor NusA [Candidatus Dormibacteraeota bacterium]|nr:transcription termination factor NusA [Candidatus Dormibacteraeota bacterium]
MTSPDEGLEAALGQLSADVGVPPEELRHVVEAALADAYRRAFAVPGPVQVRLGVGPEGIEITSAAGALPVADFKRMAAQTARTAVARHLRHLEHERALNEIERHRGELASGIVDRIERGAVYVDLGRVEGIMPPEEQIPGETLTPGRPVTVAILDGSVPGTRSAVRVSRGSRVFVLKLLEAEVPEVAAGTVAVKTIAREPGLRTKVAVASSEPGIDPVGACVGPKGVRHRSILQELGPEHVDVVPWDPDPARFVAAALGPATVLDVDIDPETRTAHVTVPRDQLSLAIGKDGQNARLAARLTGWRVDIRGGAEAAPA